MASSNSSDLGKIMANRWAKIVLPLCIALGLLTAAPAYASVALLMEEPYGDLGHFDPAGHSAVYLNHVCAESPTELRLCRPGELGVVLSRYHRIHKDDWLAMPLIPYLYSLEEISAVPAHVDPAQVTLLRDTYWRQHLTALAPPDPTGAAPKGDWTQLVGSSYDRRIHGFEIDTTREQDERLIAYFNDRRNVAHFNVLFHNCADFSRAVLDIYFPHSIHRNFIADLGITTPKQVARSLVKYGRKHPELHMTAFVIAQVPGTISRSHSVDGVSESLIKSKKYLLPLVILSPEVTGAIIVGYLVDGRMSLPKDTTVFQAAAGDDAHANVLPIEKIAGKQPGN